MKWVNKLDLLPADAYIRVAKEVGPRARKFAAIQTDAELEQFLAADSHAHEVPPDCGRRLYFDIDGQVPLILSPWQEYHVYIARIMADFGTKLESVFQQILPDWKNWAAKSYVTDQSRQIDKQLDNNHWKLSLHIYCKIFKTSDPTIELVFPSLTAFDEFYKVLLHDAVGGRGQLEQWQMPTGYFSNGWGDFDPTWIDTNLVHRNHSLRMINQTKRDNPDSVCRQATPNAKLTDFVCAAYGKNVQYWPTFTQRDPPRLVQPTDHPYYINDDWIAFISRYIGVPDTVELRVTKWFEHYYYVEPFCGRNKSKWCPIKADRTANTAAPSNEHKSNSCWFLFERRKPRVHFKCFDSDCQKHKPTVLVFEEWKKRIRPPEPRQPDPPPPDNSPPNSGPNPDYSELFGSSPESPESPDSDDPPPISDEDRAFYDTMHDFDTFSNQVWMDITNIPLHDELDSYEIDQGLRCLNRWFAQGTQTLEGLIYKVSNIDYSMMMQIPIYRTDREDMESDVIYLARDELYASLTESLFICIKH